MENFKFLHTPYINEIVFNELVSTANSSGFTKGGSNSKCAIVNNYAVLKNSNIPGHDDSYKNLIETLHNLSQAGVGAVPILGYGITHQGKPFRNGERYDSGFVVQEKASGKELLYRGYLSKLTPEQQKEEVLNYLNLLNNVPQEHFTKWVNDLKTITDSQIAVDPSKTSNFFYDKDKGFSFVDLSFLTQEKLFEKQDSNGQTHHSEFIYYSFTPFRDLFNCSFNKILTEEEQSFSDAVLESCFNKTVEGLQEVGVTQEDIDFTIQRFNLPFSTQTDKAEPTPLETFIDK